MVLNNQKCIIIEVEQKCSRESLQNYGITSPLLTLMRRTAMLMSGYRIALVILINGLGLLTGMVPAQIPTKIDLDL